MKIKVFAILIIGLLMASCSGTKSLKKGEVLYKGSGIKIKKDQTDGEWEMKKSGEKLTNLYWELWDTPNGSLFGLPNLRFIPFRLIIYNWFYNEKDSGFGYWMRNNFGETPVTIQTVQPELKIQKAVNIYENYGHFGTKGDYTLSYNKNGKKAYIHYKLMIPEAYSYRNITFRADSALPNIMQMFNKYMPLSKLKTGSEFELKEIRNEKTVLWNYLQDNGFYYVSENDILIEADSTFGKKQLDLRFTLLKNQTSFDDKRAVIHDFSMILDSVKQQNTSGRFYTWNDGRVKKKLMDKIVEVSPGDTFSLAKTNRSIRNLSDLGIFATPRITYDVVEGDSTFLHARLTADPLDASTLGLKAEGNYRNTGYIGPAIGFNLTQLNVFGGAENLTIDGNAYYDFPIGVFKERISNSSGFSLNSQLSSPLLNPPVKFIRSNLSIPRKFSAINLNFNDRKDYFTMYGFNLTLGYTWQSSRYASHRVELLNATYSDLINTTLRFDTLIAENPSLRNSLVEQFILGTGYKFRYDRTNIENRRFGYYFEGGVEFSGNLLGLADLVFSKQDAGEHKFLGVKYSQYTMLHYEARAYWQISETSQLAFRNLAGLGLSYGNSTQMPFIKQFIIGGSNSLRPINARSVGPGRYIELNEAEVNQVGDVKFEANVEYRMKLGGRLNGAIWSDMGNIFLLNEDPARPYSQIRWGKIIQDSYLTTGAGLRLNLNFLVLRVDYGVVMYAPIFIDGYKWIWQNKLPLHGPVIGFGYPF